MTDLPFDSRDLLDPGANWCPDCGLPRGVCVCASQSCPCCETQTKVIAVETQSSTWNKNTVTVIYRCSQCESVWRVFLGTREETE